MSSDVDYQTNETKAQQNLYPIFDRVPIKSNPLPIKESQTNGHTNSSNPSTDRAQGKKIVAHVPKSLPKPPNKSFKHLLPFVQQPTAAPESTLDIDLAHLNSSLQIGNKYKVFITFIESPSQFWIISDNNRKILEKVNQAIDKFKKCESFTKEIRYPMIGGNYLAKYSFDEEYYRARIKDVFKDSHGQIQLEAIFIDYGNTEVLPLVSLKPNLKEYSCVPPLCHRCCLLKAKYYVDNWTEENTSAFSSLIGERELEMEVFTKDEDLLNVELNLANPITFDEQISIGDLMVLEILPEEVKETMIPEILEALNNERRTEKPKIKIPLPIDKPTTISFGQEYQGSISFFKSPLEFSLQLNTNLEEFQVLSNTIQILYNKESELDCYSIKELSKGMCCMVNIEKQWHRSEVIEIHNDKKTATIQLLDLGYTKQVSQSCLRKMSLNFHSLPAQAYNCFLADWEPTKPQSWNLNMSDMFKDLVTDSPILVTFHTIKKNIYGVSLSVDLDNQYINIGEVLNCMGYFIHKVPIDEEAKTEIIEDDPKYFPVTLSFLVDPSLLYLRKASKSSTDAFQMLMKRLDIAYRGSSFDTQLEIIEEASYVVCSMEDERWHRCIVLEMKENNCCEVLLVDSGRREDVCIQSLRSTLVEFYAIDYFATRCHMRKIESAVDGKQWSYAATKVLEAYFKSNEVLYCQHDNYLEDDSLGVTLYELEVKKFGPLSACVKKFNNINDRLVEEGLALLVEACMFSIPNGATSPIIKQTLKYKDSTLPATSEIYVTLSHLGQYGDAYVRLTSAEDEFHEIIKELTMNTPYYESGPHEIECLPGQACVAKYDVDGKWYRAEVLSTPQDWDNGIKMSLVDYGIELVVGNPESKVYLDAVLVDIPKQAFKVDISYFLFSEGIGEIGSPSYAAFDKMYTEKQCKMIVTERIDIDNVKVNLVLLESLKLSEQLYFIHENREEEDYNVSKNSCIPLLELNAYETLKVAVTYTLEDGYVYIQKQKVPHPTRGSQYSSNENYNKFINMQEHLNNNSFAPITVLTEGTICCVHSVKYKCWRRAYVNRILEEGIQVHYVDFGIIETIPFDNSIRALPRKMTEIPAQAILCKLFNIEKNFNEGTKEICLKPLLTACLSKINVLYAIVKVIGLLPEIELKDSNGILAYQKLLNDKIIKKVVP